MRSIHRRPLVALSIACGSCLVAPRCVPLTPPADHRAAEAASGGTAAGSPPAPPGTAGTGEQERPALGPDATLDDYRRHAVLSNPGLRALHHEWRAARERAPQARALPEPRFGYTEFLQEVETRAGPQERKFSLSQPVPWPGRLLLRGSVEEKRALAARQRLLAAQLVVDEQLRRVYAETYYLGRSIAVTRQNLELLQRLESVARQKLAAGADNHPDTIRLQVEMGRLEDRLNSLVDRRRPLASRLNSILHRPADTPVPWPPGLPEPRIVADEELARRLEANNPELLALHHEVERAELERRLARQRYFPDFSVGVETIATGSAIAPGTPGSGDDPFLVTFSMELPIWYPKYRAGEREAAESLRAAEDRRTDGRARLAADLDLALYDLRDAERRLSLYRNTLIPKTEESLTATVTAYRAGTADFLDLIDAERSLLEFQLAVERALADRQLAEARIDRLLGRYAIPPASDDARDGKED